MRIDLHTHSSVSDGTDTPSELVGKAWAVGLDVVGLTDHDTFDGLDEAVTEGERLGVHVVRGWNSPARVAAAVCTSWRTALIRRVLAWQPRWLEYATAGWAGWPVFSRSWRSLVCR